MIFKTGEVAIYAASLRFCPIVKFSLYESKVMVEGKYFEIMVFATDGHGRVLIYEPLEEYTILNPVIAEYGFNDEVEKWSNETRTILEIKPNLFVCEA